MGVKLQDAFVCPVLGSTGSSACSFSAEVDDRYVCFRMDRSSSVLGCSWDVQHELEALRDLAALHLKQGEDGYGEEVCRIACEIGPLFAGYNAGLERGRLEEPISAWTTASALFDRALTLQEIWNGRWEGPVPNDELLSFFWFVEHGDAGGKPSLRINWVMDLDELSTLYRSPVTAVFCDPWWSLTGGRQLYSDVFIDDDAYTVRCVSCYGRNDDLIEGIHIELDSFVSAGAPVRTEPYCGPLERAERALRRGKDMGIPKRADVSTSCFERFDPNDLLFQTSPMGGERETLRRTLALEAVVMVVSFFTRRISVEPLASSDGLPAMRLMIPTAFERLWYVFGDHLVDSPLRRCRCCGMPIVADSKSMKRKYCSDDCARRYRRGGRPGDRR